MYIHTHIYTFTPNVVSERCLCSYLGLTLAKWHCLSCTSFLPSLLVKASYLLWESEEFLFFHAYASHEYPNTLASSSFPDHRTGHESQTGPIHLDGIWPELRRNALFSGGKVGNIYSRSSLWNGCSLCLSSWERVWKIHTVQQRWDSGPRNIKPLGTVISCYTPLAGHVSQSISVLA